MGSKNDSTEIILLRDLLTDTSTLTKPINLIIDGVHRGVPKFAGTIKPHFHIEYAPAFETSKVSEGAWGYHGLVKPHFA